MTKGHRKHLRSELIGRWDGRCCYCGRSIPRRKATIDHLIPESRNGSYREPNLVICCRNCNQAKRDRTPEEWAADILAVRPAGEPGKEVG